MLEPERLEDPSLALTLRECGFRNVVELAEMETISASRVEITSVPFLGEHADLNIYSKLAYLVRAGRRSLLCAADVCNVEPTLYHRVHDVIGDVDVLFLGMECAGAPMSWLYGPLLLERPDRAADESRRLSGSNFEQALALVDTMNCRDVYVYANGAGAVAELRNEYQVHRAVEAHRRV